MEEKTDLSVPALPWGWGAALFLAAAAILAHQLLIHPIVGLADNGDYDRITALLGIQADAADPADRYFNFVPSHFQTRPPVHRRYRSSELLLAGIARLVAWPFSKRGTFDLRFIGGVHAGALLGAWAVLWRASRRLAAPVRLGAGAFWVFAFTDVGYVAPLNSFYAQAGSLVFLFWTVAFAGLALVDRRPQWPVAGYFAAAALFVLSKPQESVQALPLAAFGVVLAIERRNVRRSTVALGAAALVVAGGILLAGTRGAFRNGALYKIVFYELLPHSPDPRRDLREMGLDPDDARFSGTTNYGNKSPFRDPAVRARLFPKLGYSTIFRFYAAHPSRVVDELRRAAPAGLVLPAQYGNFEKSAGFGPGARSAAYSAWTRFRRLGVGHAALVLGLFYGANFLLAAAGRFPRSVRAALAVLVAMGAAAFAVSSLVSAHLDIVRKLYVFHAITDLLVVADLVLALQGTTARWKTSP